MICDKCGNEITEDSAFCKFCGYNVNPDAELPGAEPQLSDEELKKSRRKGCLSAAIVFVGVAAALVVFLFLFMKSLA